MIRRIEKILKDVRMETHESTANRILTDMEYAGMLPPDKTIQDPEFPHSPSFQWEKEEK